MSLSKPRPRSLMSTAVKDLSRLGTITNVLLRHGFLGIAFRAGLPANSPSPEDRPQGSELNPKDQPAEAARGFRLVLEELGPAFVKVGQILSTRPDLLPPVFIEELTKLQDQVPPMPKEDCRKAVEAGLGGSLEDFFEHFEEQPLASASMAETHVARLVGGQEVVVKIQRPGIEETIRADLDLLFLFAKLLELTIQEMEVYAPGDIIRALDEGLSMELDFHNEAQNLEQFAEIFKDEADIKIPKFYPSHSSRTILTMERIRGKKLAELELNSEESQRIAQILLEALYTQIYLHGLFHADPHPGNLFVTDDGRLAFIDFGLCGYLSPSQQDQLITLIVSVVAGDVDGIARILLRMGRPLGPINMTAFKAEIASIRDRYMRQSLKTIDAAAFSRDCIDATQRYRIRIATEYALLGKTSATVDGILRTLDPNFNILKEGQHYARRMLAHRYSSPRLMQEAFSGLMSLSTFLREVPDHLSQILLDAESGTLQVRLENDALRHLGAEINTQTTRLFMGMCCAALTIATPLFLGNEALWFRGIPVLTCLCFGTATLLWWFGIGWHLMAGRLHSKIRVGPFLEFMKRLFFRD